MLVTEAKATVTKLNQRARAERILPGETEARREVELADGNRASVGDLIVTRRDQRHLRSLRGGWVHNGDRWRVTDVTPDGSVIAARIDQKIAGTVVLPAGYVREHMDLGYAITAPPSPRTHGGHRPRYRVRCDQPREPLRFHDARTEGQHRLTEPAGALPSDELKRSPARTSLSRDRS